MKQYGTVWTGDRISTIKVRMFSSQQRDPTVRRWKNLSRTGGCTIRKKQQSRVPKLHLGDETKKQG